MNKTQTAAGSRAIGIIIEGPDWVSRARRTALAAAGLDEGAVTFTRTAESEFLGRKLYETEFTNDNLGYECYIDAQTWEVSGLNFWPIEI
jgi:hypothetical protein